MRASQREEQRTDVVAAQSLVRRELGLLQGERALPGAVLVVAEEQSAIGLEGRRRDIRGKVVLADVAHHEGILREHHVAAVAMRLGHHRLRDTNRHW